MAIGKIKEITSKQGVTKYLHNTAWLLAEKILRLILGVFVGIWVARYLGPEQFGLFSYASSFVGIFLAFSTLGLDGIIIRELVKDESRRDSLIGTAFGLKLIGAFILIVLLAITINFTLNSPLTNALVFIIASSTIFQSFNVIDYYFQSKVLSKYVVYSNTIGLVISSFVKVYLVMSSAPLIAFAWVVLFDSFILAAGLIFFYIKNKLRIFSWDFDWALAKALLRDSWFLILSGVVSSIYMQIDQVMLQSMLGSNAVGQYAAAVRLSEVWYFFPMIVSSSLFPAIINAKRVSDELYYGRLQKLYDLMVWLAVIIALLMTIFGERIVSLLYGMEYSEAGAVLVIHTWASIFIFIGVVSNKWFITENLQKYAFYRAAVGAVVNVVLNFHLIPLYGIYGAAISTLISLLIADYLYNAVHGKTRVTFKLHTNAFLFPLRWAGVKLK